jgi:hypothetical protein
MRKQNTKQLPLSASIPLFIIFSPVLLIESIAVGLFKAVTK